MKFAVVVVVLALALGIESSAIAWGPHYAPSLTYTSVSGPAILAAPAVATATAWDNGAWGDHGSDSWDDGAWGDHGSDSWNNGAWDARRWGDHGAWAAPAAVAVDGAWGHGAWAAPAAVATHAAIIPAAHSTWGHEGSYVAKTRGAVHVAPLAGHANSAASINLQPAPGTV